MQEVLEVVGQGRGELHGRARDGMFKRERRGVEQLPLQVGERLGERGRPVARGWRTPP